METSATQKQETPAPAPSAVSPLPAHEAPITSIQPGGGFCFNLERAWCRGRRAVLKRFFPGHVSRMKGLRQGDCPDCAHDVIDPRDLKLFRNVCAVSFRPEDDRYAWRGRIGLARAGLAEIVCASLVLLPLIGLCVVLALWVHLAWLVPAGVLLPVWLFILAFFRDPNRTVPTDADALVSPADGVVTHLDEVEERDFPGGRAFRVSIFLSVFNVHVNRLPRSGKVKRVAYYPGEFLDARHHECSVRNEQLWVDLEDERTGCLVRVKQTAGAIARRIVCWLRVGETVAAGERYGMIKFGSRTEVLVPPEAVAEVKVRVGQAVKGGRDVLLRLRECDKRGE